MLLVFGGSCCKDLHNVLLQIFIFYFNDIICWFLFRCIFNFSFTLVAYKLVYYSRLFSVFKGLDCDVEWSRLLVKCLSVDVCVRCKKIFDHIVTTFQASPMESRASFMILWVTRDKTLADQIMSYFDIVWLSCKMQTIHACFHAASRISTCTY